jgi:DNA mismatch repair ATPase MutS
VVRYVKASNHLISKYWDDNIIGTFIKPNEIFKEANIESSYVGKLRDVRFSIFSNFGRQLHDYKYISKDLITSLLSKSYVLDFMFATCTYRKKNGYSFASYTDNVQPYVLLQGARHPCLEHDVVKNDFELKDRNVIITGPNAGGKSTFIKTFITCIILSQTVCISPSDVCELTPFKNIVSQINVPDCKGKESLFEAEMHRCQETTPTVC